MIILIRTKNHNGITTDVDTDPYQSNTYQPDDMLMILIVFITAIAKWIRQANILSTHWGRVMSVLIIQAIFNTLRPKQNGRQFPADIFKGI